MLSGKLGKAQTLTTHTCVSDLAREACYTHCNVQVKLLAPAAPMLGGSWCLFFVSPAHHSLHLWLLEVGVAVVSSSTVCRRQWPAPPLGLRRAILNPAGVKGHSSSMLGTLPHASGVTRLELCLLGFLLECWGCLSGIKALILHHETTMFEGKWTPPTLPGDKK